MDTLLREIRLALRRLRQAPGFTVFAVASLALGIGVSTAIYSAVRTLLWMPLGIAKADELVLVGNRRFSPAMSWLDFQDFRAQQTTCAAVAAGAAIRTAFRAGTVTQTVFGEAVTGQYFAVLGLHAKRGRLLDAQDETSRARVAVVSEAFWRTKLSSEDGVIGRVVSLGGEPFEVVGVVAGTFRGLEVVLPQSIWIPVTALPVDSKAFSLRGGLFEQRQTTTFDVWARALPGTPPARVSAEAATLAQRLNAAYPLDRGAPTRAWEARMLSTDSRRGTEAVRTFVIAILVAIAVVLLIACTNLANLALARGTARAHETAVRTALGASRWRLVREQLIESAVIVACGGALGLVILVRLVDYFAIDLPLGRGVAIPFKPEIDTAVLAASLLAMITAIVVFGVWPALQSTRADVRRGLGAGGGATTAKWRMHRNLIAWQVCGSVALLLVSIMSIRIIRAPMGAAKTPAFRELALAQIDFTLNGLDEVRARQTTDAIVASLRGIPGIQSVSASNGSPNSWDGTRMYVTTPDEPFTAARDSGKLGGVSATTPGFLATLKVPLARGRDFTDRDDVAAPGVGIVTEQLARDLFQTTDVVGRTVLVAAGARLNGRSPAPRAVSIVGVSRDIQSSPTATRPDRLLFVPLAQQYESRAPILIIARAADPSAGVARLRTEIRRVAPELVVSAAGTGAVLLEGPYFLLRVIAAFAAALGALALVLAMAGLFGILTHVVERRTREIGIRLAIGAERGQILRLVLRDGVHPVVKGLILGLTIGLGSRIVLRGQIFTTIGAWDPLEFCVLPLVFVVSALIACALPAARASRVDPNVALRDL
ncbi:MAG TPA: ABC transporter permease [Vicinamibacterales bacterium]|nr:ABC transporter permease [Vicinamibacterales bacterium]